MRRARIHDGWLVVPLDGDELTPPAYLSVGRGEPGDWVPAFLDRVDGRPVAMIDAAGLPRGRVSVWRRVGTTITRMGTVRL